LIERPFMYEDISAAMDCWISSSLICCGVRRVRELEQQRWEKAGRDLTMSLERTACVHGGLIHDFQPRSSSSEVRGGEASRTSSSSSSRPP
ncbi:hypothetical protein KCU90_g246, partial [Aureobasidium melanogenum]